jgi:hypothetical protein
MGGAAASNQKRRPLIARVGHGLGLGDVSHSRTTWGTIEFRAATSQRKSLVKLDTGAAG